MKTRASLFLFSFLLISGLAAQTATTPAAPAAAPAAGAPAANAGRGGGGGGGGTQNSPEVNAAARTFTVRYRAPNATRVEVIGEIPDSPGLVANGNDRYYPMTKADNGVWSVTIGPLVPDVYNYQIRADGIVAMDPANPQIKIGFGGFPPANMVEIPGKESDFQDTRDVPHGSIRVETYHSKEFGGAARTLWVYTPPGYDASTSRYPVFYLLNGSGNTDSSWILTGRANTIMDNLIADGKAKPMILVSPMGYARAGVGTGPDKTFDTTGQTTGENFWYTKEFMGDIIPYVDGHFRTLTDADNRAIGGLSMGGGHTVSIAFANPDTFHSIVVMSAGIGGGGRAGGAAPDMAALYPKMFGDPAATNKKMKFLWVGAGGNDMALAGAKALDAAYTAKGIKHAPFWTLEGARHEWIVWRHALNDVAPQLFR